MPTVQPLSVGHSGAADCGFQLEQSTVVQCGILASKAGLGGNAVAVCVVRLSHLYSVLRSLFTVDEHGTIRIPRASVFPEESLAHLLEHGAISEEFAEMLPAIASDFGLPPPRNDDDIQAS